MKVNQTGAPKPTKPGAADGRRPRRPARAVKAATPVRRHVRAISSLRKVRVVPPSARVSNATTPAPARVSSTTQSSVRTTSGRDARHFRHPVTVRKTGLAASVAPPSGRKTHALRDRRQPRVCLDRARNALRRLSAPHRFEPWQTGIGLS